MLSMRGTRTSTVVARRLPSPVITRPPRRRGYPGGETTMSAPRRLGAPDAKNRTVLMDAAEQLMLEQGWATVTSRRIAEHAGLKPQLVHYYFRSMDELFLE